VRTERWKYIHWTQQQGMAEMYDLEKDPHELQNLAFDPAHAKVRQAMKKELRKLTSEALGI
jgi:arylsulfatase A-like enzyme